MITFIRRKLYKLIRWAQRYGEDVSEAIPSSFNIQSPIKSNRTSGNGNLDDSINGLNFTVYRANGGTIIQTHCYNLNTDKSRTELYIITDQQDLGDEIGQIITRENLSR